MYAYIKEDCLYIYIQVKIMSLQLSTNSTMLALSPSPPLFSTIGWPLDDLTSHNQNYSSIYKDPETFSEYSFPDHQLSPSAEAEIRSTASPAVSDDPTMVKKLNHNASERDRRKKINRLYSSLRSLLPAADQMKKLSIPATVSRVLKYIPELQEQVEGLIKKKEELLLRISPQGDIKISKESERKAAHPNPFFVVSTNRLSDNEAMIQISSFKIHKTPLSEILPCLEKDGLLLLNASSFETFGGRIFHNLHFQVDKTCSLESEILSEKLLSIYQKKQGIF